MDERRFRSLGVMVVLLAALVLNAGPLQRVIFDGADAVPALTRHALVLSAGYVGLRVLESIAFRAPHESSENGGSGPRDGAESAERLAALRVGSPAEN